MVSPGIESKIRQLNRQVIGPDLQHKNLVLRYRGNGKLKPVLFIKSEDACLIANLIRLKKEGYIPNRDIIVALTADEEMGNANGVDWLLTNHRELIDADFCINPDGDGGDLKNGKHMTMVVQTSEKIYVSYQLEVKNNHVARGKCNSCNVHRCNRW